MIERADSPGRRKGAETQEGERRSDRDRERAREQQRDRGRDIEGMEVGWGRDDREGS